MVKIYFAGIAVFVLAVVGVFSTVLGPLVAGADRNLGGDPTMPFHSPVPQPVAAFIGHTVSLTTPDVLLTGIIGLIALLAVYTIGTFAAQLIRRHRAHRRAWAELRWRGRVAAAVRKGPTPSSTVQSTAEFESMWK